MADSRVTGYADALFAVAAAEGDLATVEDELFRLAQTLRSDEQLGSTLADQGVPASRRQQVVEDLLGGKASATTTALVSMVVGAGRAAELPAIVDALVERSAASRNKAVATVRSAVDLTARGAASAQADKILQGTQHQPVADAVQAFLLQAPR